MVEVVVVGQQMSVEDLISMRSACVSQHVHIHLLEAESSILVGQSEWEISLALEGMSNDAWAECDGKYQM